MPQCMGQCGRTWVESSIFSWSGFPLRAGVWSQTLSASRSLEGRSRIQSRSGRRASRDPPAVGTYQGDFLWELLPFQPLPSTGAGKPPSTDLQGVTVSPAPLPTRESRSLDKWVRDIVRGLVLPSGGEKPTAHFIYYIICDCVQFADTLMMVSMYGIFGIWLSQDGMKWNV